MKKSWTSHKEVMKISWIIHEQLRTIHEQGINKPWASHNQVLNKVWTSHQQTWIISCHSCLRNLFEIAKSQANILKFWENFQPELLNQKVCRLLLSVHKRCSRLAVLGELGRYPVLIPALKHCLKYQYHIDTLDNGSLVSEAIWKWKATLR